MKKLISLILILTTLFCAVSCIGTQKDVTNDSISSNSEQSGNSSDDKLGTDAQTAKKEDETEAIIKERQDINSIKRTAVRSWREIGFSFEDAIRAIAVNIPSDWTLSEQSPKTYSILRNGKEIGRITSELPKNVKEINEVAKATSNAITTKHEIHLIETDTEYIYRHSFTFAMEYGTKTYASRLQVDYGELDDAAAKHILESVDKVEHREGNIKIPVTRSNGKDKILIIGNSFVRTSGISDFLKNFISSGKKKTVVNIQSINGAVMRVYATEEILSPIREGKYSVVFLCGLYYDADIPVINTFLKACEKGGAVLVVFPAHNERYPQIPNAKNQYPNVIFLDWKKEIDDIIATGVNYWEFCENDAYHHSKAPAGYIGAHMIYTALYDEIPAEYTGKRLTMTKIRQLVGDDYIKTGFTREERKITIYPLEQ